jgi:HPt (histidine-containing phosphotransfer) domain-containing protein
LGKTFDEGKKYNLAFLEDYFEENGESILTILKMYVDETPKEISIIENALFTKDTATVKAVTHKIKANITMLGIHDKSSFVNDMHRLKSTDAITENIIQQFETFKRTVGEALDEIHRDFFPQ